MTASLVLIVLAALVAGWVAHKTYLKFAPSERAVALKAATKALSALAALQSTTPEAVAAAAAAQAHEAALLAAFKDAAAKLQ